MFQSQTSITVRSTASAILATLIGVSLLSFETVSGTASAAPQSTKLQLDSAPDVRTKISPALYSRMLREDAANFPVLIYLKAQADLAGADQLATREAKGRFVYNALVATARSSQGSLLARLAELGLEHQRYFVTNMIAVFSPTAAQIEEFAARSDVQRVVADPRVNIRARPTPEMLRRDHTEAVGTNVTSTGAERVWTQFSNRGEGIVVAGQDTGVQWDHPALRASYRGTSASGVNHNYSWHDAIRRKLTDTEAANPCGYATVAPCDDNAHGTHTVGSIVGDDGAGNQIGMAPGAKWIACRNMDEGVGTPSTYIECFQYFLAPWPYGGNPMTDGDPTKAPHVINNSWGCPPSEGCDGAEFLPVIEALGRAGIMVVVSAGNDGPGCSTIKDGPAYHSAATLSVGAHDHRSGNIAGFSSRGPSTFDNKVGPDLTAPGVSIRSAIPGGGFSGAAWSGTSMAGPHVVGAVALLWSVKPDLVGKIARTSELLTSTATPKTSTQTCGGVPGTTVPNNTFGHGLLNVHAAVVAASR